MNFDQFAKTLGPAAAPDVSNPLGASNAGVIGNYLKGGFLASAAGRATGAGTAQAQVAAQNAQAQADFAKKQQITALSTKAQQLVDNSTGKNYQKVGKADGGFDFFDATGKPITVQDYAQATGKTPKQVLANSDNSLDQQYIAHQKLTENLVNAIVDNNATARDKLYKANPGLQEATKGLTGQQIIQQFQAAYPHVYGGTQPQTQLQSPAQDFGGKPPAPAFNLLNPSTYAPAVGGVYNNLVSTLGG